MTPIKRRKSNSLLRGAQTAVVLVGAATAATLLGVGLETLTHYISGNRVNLPPPRISNRIPIILPLPPQPQTKLNRYPYLKEFRVRASSVGHGLIPEYWRYRPTRNFGRSRRKIPRKIPRRRSLSRRSQKNRSI